MMAFILVYIGVGLCVAYGWRKGFDFNIPSVAESFSCVIDWPIIMMDGDLRERVYYGWSK